MTAAVADHPTAAQKRAAVADAGELMGAALSESTRFALLRLSLGELRLLIADLRASRGYPATRVYAEPAPDGGIGQRVLAVLTLEPRAPAAIVREVARQGPATAMQVFGALGKLQDEGLAACGRGLWRRIT